MDTKNETKSENVQSPTPALYEEQVRKLVAIRAFLISLEKENSGGDECIIDWVKRVIESLQSRLTKSEADNKRLQAALEEIQLTQPRKCDCEPSSGLYACVLHREIAEEALKEINL